MFLKMICQKLCQTRESKSRSLKMNYLVAISLATAGPQLRVPDLSGHFRSSTATSRSQWALADNNRELQIGFSLAHSIFHSLAYFTHLRVSCIKKTSLASVMEINPPLLQIAVIDINPTTIMYHFFWQTNQFSPPGTSTRIGFKAATPWNN